METLVDEEIIEYDDNSSENEEEEISENKYLLTKKNSGMIWS